MQTFEEISCQNGAVNEKQKSFIKFEVSYNALALAKIEEKTRQNASDLSSAKKRAQFEKSKKKLVKTLQI